MADTPHARHARPQAELDENGGGDDDDVDEEDSEMGAAPIRGPARVARGIRTR
jgi:hypothetical protein